MAKPTTAERESRKDNLFGQILVRRGHCTREQLEQCIAEQQAARDGDGPPPRLGELLIRKGYVGMRQVEQVLGDIAASVPLSCPKCKTVYRLLPEDLKSPRCRKPGCGGLLPLAAAGPSDATLRQEQIHDEGGTSLLSVSLADAPLEVRKAAKDPKKLFDKFVLVRQLGQGGMGVVFQAWDTGLKSMVALKFLMGGALEGLQSTQVQRFLQEARTAAALAHSNICRTFDVRQARGKYYICMEYVDGKALGEEPLPPSEIAQALRQVALALDHAHEQGVIHRDVKPSNILIETGGRPVIMDFGIAKSVGGDSQLTQTGAVIGSPAYMSPEQASGDPKKIDRRCDVYSLGATLYHLLTGKPPFQGNSPLDTLMKARTRPVTPPSKVAENVPPALENICLRALAKDPRARYQTAREMAADLERFLGGGKVARAAEPARSGGRRGRRPRAGGSSVPAWIWPVTGGAALLLVLLVAALLSRGSGEPEPTDPPTRKKDPPRAARQADPPPVAVTPKKQAPLVPVASGPAAEGRELLRAARAELRQVGLDRAMTRDKLKRAVALLSRAAEQKERPPHVHTDLARAQLLLFDYLGAEESLAQAIQLAPTHGENYALRGRLYLQRNLEEMIDLSWVLTPQVERRLSDLRTRASGDLRRAAQLGAGEMADELQAALAFAERRMDECIKLCDAGLARDARQETLYKLRGDAAYYRLSVSKLARSQLASILADYTKALALRPGYCEALLMRGNAYSMTDELEKARADIEAALELRPDDPTACWFMGSYFTKKAERTGQTTLYGQSLMWFGRGLDHKPGSFINLMQRALAYLKLQRYAEAEADLTRALEVNPGHNHGWYLKGGLLSKQQRWAEAAEMFKKSLELNPRFYSAWYNLGAVYYNSGQWRPAKAALEKALECGHPQPDRVRQMIAAIDKRLGQ